MKPSNIKLLNKISTKESFEEFYIKLEETHNIKPNEIKEMALEVRGNYKWAIKLLKLALRKISQESKNAYGENPELEESEVVKYNKDIANEIMIYMAAILFNNGIRPARILQKCEEDNSSDPRIAIIKGYQYYIEKGYENALFEFSKINYTKGISLCNIMLRKKKEIFETNDLFLISFISSSVWEKLRAQLKVDEGENPYYKDFIYRINSTKAPGPNENDTAGNSEENSIDVMLSKLKYEENEIGKLLSLGLEYKDKCYLAEIHYSIGKIYHKIQDLENARGYYLMALESDGDYLPAIYNLMRIDQKGVYRDGNGQINSKDGYGLLNCTPDRNNDFSNSTAINDYNALIAIKEMNCSFDFNKFRCSSPTKRFYSFFIGCEKLEVSKIGLIENILCSLYGDKKTPSGEGSSKTALDLGDINLSLYGDRIEYCGISVDLVVLLNNLGILYFMSGEKAKSQKTFEKSIELQSSMGLGAKEPNGIDRAEFLRYNLILSNGLDKNEEGEPAWEDLKGIGFKEAQINYLYSKRSDEGLPLSLLYYLKIDSERNQAMEFFRNEFIKKSDLFSRICLCHMHLQQHEFKEATDLCFKQIMIPSPGPGGDGNGEKRKDGLAGNSNGTSSFYIMNILGVIYAKKGFLKEAVELLEQVFLDLDLNLNKTNCFKSEVCLNLGNCYFLMDEHAKCIKYYKLSVSNRSPADGDSLYVRRILLSICYKSKSLKLVDVVIEFYKLNPDDSDDLKRLNNLRLELLIKDKRFLDAREFATKEKLFLEEGYLDGQEAEMERKRKEIEEYRKRKRFQ